MFNPTTVDIGRRVIYSWTEEWILKSFNDEKKVAMVVYHWSDTPEKYEDFTGAMTNYADLIFK